VRLQDRNEMAALLFSAKEAFYKCWYPVCRTRFDFHEVEVLPSVQCATFELCFPGRQAFPLIPPRRGSFALAEGHVATAVIWWQHGLR
jgi:enterobactin synthetase component D